MTTVSAQLNCAMAASNNTDYDLVCAMEGVRMDFRAEFGRYFVCECKDWRVPAGTTELAKFCRVLDSVKTKFGILFSKHSISGKGSGDDAAREQLKVFQDRGIIIVVIDEPDLNDIANDQLDPHPTRIVWALPVFEIVSMESV